MRSIPNTPTLISTKENIYNLTGIQQFAVQYPDYVAIIHLGSGAMKFVFITSERMREAKDFC